MMPAQGSRPHHTVVAAVLSAIAFLAAAGAANAATVVGQTFVPTDAYAPGYTALQEGSPGGQYAVPSAGVLTSWSFQAPDTQVPTGLKFKVARPGGVEVFSIIGESTPKNPTPGLLSTYADISIPVQAGDVIGLYTGTVMSRMQKAVPASAGYVFTDTAADEPPGGPKGYDGPYNDRQLDVSATLEADCDGDGLGDETEDPLLAGGTCPIQDRFLTLDANKNEVQKGKRVRLTGRLDAAGDLPACETAQPIDLERKQDGSFEPVKSLTTAADGSFSTRLRIRRTSKLRATVDTSPPCAAAVSDRERVKLAK